MIASVLGGWVKRVVLATVIVTVLGMLATPASAETPAQPFEYRVNAVNGSGCRPGTYEVSALPDNGGIRVEYHDFRAAVGAGALPTDFRKNCQVSVQIRPPAGYTYAVSEREFVGTADIARGSTGLLRTNHYYAGAPPSSFVNHPFPGGYVDTWQAVDTIESAAMWWVWCDMAASLNGNVEARVTRGTASPETISFLALQSATYRFLWRRCASST